MPLKPKEIRELAVEELKTKYNTLTAELFELRHHAKSGKLEKPATIWNTKKDIARILTVLREKGVNI